MITLRFVTGNDITSRLIRFQAGVSMPFTPSHVEALTLDGQDYVGAHLDGGVELRPVGYDAAGLMILADGTRSERLVHLPCTDEQESSFYAFVHSRVGAPYDWKAILGFVDPRHLHDIDHIICSAFITMALRHCGYFATPLTVPFHHISPRDLLLVLSSHVEIPH